LFYFPHRLIHFYCSGSCHRLTIFNTKTENESNTKDILDKIGDKRTSHRHIALQNLQQNFDAVCQTAIEIIDVESIETFSRSRYDANLLLQQLAQIDTTLPLVMWRTVLTSVSHANNYLQHPELNMFEACSLLKSLPDCLQTIKNDFGKLEEEARALFSHIDLIHDGASVEPNSGFNTENFLPLLDRLITGINVKSSQYDDVCNRFGFLTNFMNDTSVETICFACDNLIDKYPDDFGENLTIEMVEYVTECVVNIANKTADNLFQNFVESSLQQRFPNVYICFKIFLCLPITNRERLFSMMAIAKENYHEMRLEKTLPSLQLLLVENEMIDFESMIEAKPTTMTAVKNEF
jgi:hypothetical protein